MEYLVPIVKYLSWPLLILVSYLAVLRALMIHEKQTERDEKDAEE